MLLSARTEPHLGFDRRLGRLKVAIRATPLETFEILVFVGGGLRVG